MRGTTCALLAGVALALASAETVSAQNASSQASQTAPLPQTALDALKALTDAAGVIFTGTVTAVRRPSPAAPGAAAVVEIDFAVADAVRGVSGQTYTLREWAGLWPANDRPFVPGQRYLMLLHTPNAAGLSSPMGGPDGAIPIRAASLANAAGEGLVAASSIAATTTTATNEPGLQVDLGWIATRVVVPLVYATAAHPIAAPHTFHPETVRAPADHADSVQDAIAISATATPASSGLPAGTPTSVRSLAYGPILNQLRTWEAARDAAR